MIKKILILTCISLALLVPQNAKAAQITNDQVVDEYKNWTIHFNREVAFDDLSKQGIVVTDSKGNKVDVQLELGKDNKSIIVEYPTWGYLLDEKYQLTINNKVHDTDNKCIKQPVCINFKVEPESKDAVIFKDKAFQDSVKNYIKKPNGEILKSDVEKLTRFDTFGINAEYANIENISGIDKFTNLSELYLDNNKISDISPLEQLINLENIALDNTKVSDINPLSSLANLKSISLNFTQVSDITPLKQLGDLKSVDLCGTKIEDISALEDLTGLESLALNNTKISDITPLKKLYNLEVLDLSNTKVSDISALNELKNLVELDLTNSPIKNLNALKGLDNLESLRLDNTQVSDIDTLKELKNLKELIVSGLSDSEQKILENALPNCRILGL